MTFEPAQRWHRHAERTTSLFVLAFGMGLLASNTGADAGVPFLFQNSHTRNIGLGASPFDVAMGDFNQDQYADVVVAAATFEEGFVLMMGAPGNPPFGRASLVTVDPLAPTEHNGQGVLVADFNNDGNQDVAFSREIIGVTISPGNGDGTFGAAVTVHTGVSVGELSWPLRMRALDLENDGDVDLTLTDGRNENIYVLRNNGGLSFELTHTIPIQGTTQLDVGDLDGDGLDDLAWAVSAVGIKMALSNGDGTFAAPIDVPISPTPAFCLSIVDLDLDGHNDILAGIPNGEDSKLAIMINTGVGASFTVTYHVLPDAIPNDILPADFDGDQRIDVAVLDAGGTIFFMRNETTIPGQFAFSVPFHVETAGLIANRIAVGNFDADCDYDLVAINSIQSSISVIRNLSEQFNQCTIADFDYDGLVTGTDLIYLLNEWGKANSPADLNLSGRVEGMDLAFLLWGWQQPIPQR